MKEQMKEEFIRAMQDDNPGIPPDEVERIFNQIYPYYKFMRIAEYKCIS